MVLVVMAAIARASSSSSPHPAGDWGPLRRKCSEAGRVGGCAGSAGCDIRTVLMADQCVQ